MSGGQPGASRVVLVTGGGGGIGAAIALELGRRGDHVVTVDPLVSVDGTVALSAPEETTAGRIVAAGGSAEASSASVTDREAMEDLVADVVDARGRIDAVVNVAGITRPTGFAKGEEDDWAAVLAVHLDGYRNVLHAVLPHMAAARRGHVVGVTSGSGWRAADAGAYSCAKRAVASLTWQLGRVAPEGVAVNALSPIAMTRMVTAALGRAGGSSSTAARPGGSAATGGLSLGSMPAPEDLGPLGAWLAGHGAALRGEILFAGGSEVALLDPPRLMEVVRTCGAISPDHVCEGVLDALVAAEAAQATTGGVTPRFGPLFSPSSLPSPSRPPRSSPGDEAPAVAVISDRSELAAAVLGRLDVDAGHAVAIDPRTVGAGVDGARSALTDARTALGRLDAVVVAMAGSPAAAGGAGWEGVLASHDDLVTGLHDDGRWARAVADLAASLDAPVRLITVVDAATAGGRSRAQAVAQLSRAAGKATAERVIACAVALEAPDGVETAAALVGVLATRPAAARLAGAELVVGPGWLGLRSHPRPTGSIAFGGPELPDWFDDVVGEMVR